MKCNDELFVGVEVPIDVRSILIRTNWPRKVRELIPDTDSWSQRLQDRTGEDRICKRG